MGEVTQTVYEWRGNTHRSSVLLQTRAERECLCFLRILSRTPAVFPYQILNTVNFLFWSLSIPQITSCFILFLSFMKHVKILCELSILITMTSPLHCEFPFYLLCASPITPVIIGYSFYTSMGCSSLSAFQNVLTQAFLV